LKQVVFLPSQKKSGFFNKTGLMLCIDFLEQVPALQVSAKEAIGETSIFFWTHEDMWYLRWLHNYDSELTVLLLFSFFFAQNALYHI